MPSQLFKLTIRSLKVTSKIIYCYTIALNKKNIIIEEKMYRSRDI